MKKTLFTLRGKVVRGTRIGRKLGFPTANIDRREYVRKKLRIPFGVYAGIAVISGGKKAYPAGIVIGPLDKKGLPKIEAHLLDFSGTLYGKELCLSITRYLRRYKVFKSEASLKKAIAGDLKRVRFSVTLSQS
jgi:riboflavin kinase/FMN adenylyltransferase